MNEGDSEKIVHLHQAEFNALTDGVVDYILDRMNEHKQLKAKDVLRAVYQACLIAGDKVDIFTYKGFLEEVAVMNGQCLATARAGFDLAAEKIAKESLRTDG